MRWCVTPQHTTGKNIGVPEARGLWLRSPK
nr:MAG TPA: hypothetical protein [Caudoviricetes sp.]